MEEAFREALRDSLKAALAGLAVDLGRIAERLAGGVRLPPFAFQGTFDFQDTSAEETPDSESSATAEAETAPEPRACAVIGCRQPVRSLGYCAAHYQKRRLMVATGRLHSAWVEDAAPHSIPDVILSRRRREASEKAAPRVEVAQPSAPRAWIRKKGQPVPTSPSATEASPKPLPGPATARHAENGDVAATLARWATEFRSGKRNG
ncbi:cell wall protein [Pyxidicoccus fallax]|uniref:cell wall protein n=1 Tax=Pyxidicoccus fallax TaxID=394095 RepID=UPI001B7D7276|nr:cell wall protein [Pyxidicoccus fallax]